MVKGIKFVMFHEIMQLKFFRGVLRMTFTDVFNVVKMETQNLLRAMKIAKSTWLRNWYEDNKAQYEFGDVML